jgi:hypothetical protein
MVPIISTRHKDVFAAEVVLEGRVARYRSVAKTAQARNPARKPAFWDSL